MSDRIRSIEMKPDRKREFICQVQSTKTQYTAGLSFMDEIFYNENYIDPL